MSAKRALRCKTNSAHRKMPEGKRSAGPTVAGAALMNRSSADRVDDSRQILGE
jgi:hypothetical protein